jgi:hypothetical protein
MGNTELVHQPSCRIEAAEIADKLSQEERQTFAQYERTIQKYGEAFFEVGVALLSIREHRLYRETHRTFESYCDERLGFTKAHANRLIASVPVVKNLASIDAKPKNLAQTRPLVRLTPDQQQQAWGLASQKAAGNEVTAFALECAASTVSPKNPPRSGTRTKEQKAKMERNRERRDKKWKLLQEKADRERREVWEKDIQAVRSPLGHGIHEPVYQDIELAITNVVEQGAAEGDVAFFRGGRLLALVIFDHESHVVVRRDAMVKQSTSCI